jgi:anionic cell wall polymer biosynthesis LytR-Cps2A-Psr (LCP) family protein
VDVQLAAPTGGYTAGAYHFNGQDALAFVRERSTSDDFSRMQRTQTLILATGTKAFQPSNWNRLPSFIYALIQTVDTNIPLWQLPRLILALLRVPFVGVDSRTITSQMAVPFQTSGGAQVLAPIWEAINPVLLQMFGR